MENLVSNGIKHDRNDLIIFVLIMVLTTVAALTLNVPSVVEMILWGVVVLAALAALVTAPIVWHDARKSWPQKRERSDLEREEWPDNS